MGKKNLESNLRQWSKIPPEKRKERMRPLSEARWKGITTKQRKAHASMMAKKRWEKNENNSV